MGHYNEIVKINKCTSHFLTTNSNTIPTIFIRGTDFVGTSFYATVELPTLCYQVNAIWVPSKPRDSPP